MKIFRSAFFCVVFLLGFFCSCQFPIVPTLVAGSKTMKVQGFEDGSGEIVKFKTPFLVYSEHAHKGLFIVDKANHRIRFMDSQGIVSTFAGNGKEHTESITAGSSHSLDSEIDSPESAVIHQDTLYFDSTGCIRSIDLKVPKSEMKIKTLYGTCRTQAYIQQAQEKARLNEQFPAALMPDDQFNCIYDTRLYTVNSKNELFVGCDGHLYRITSSKKINEIINYLTERQNNSSGELYGPMPFSKILLGSSDKPYLFVNLGVLPMNNISSTPLNEPISLPDGENTVLAFEIQNDNSTKEYQHLQLYPFLVATNFTQGKFLVVGYDRQQFDASLKDNPFQNKYQYIYQLDTNLKLKHIATLDLSDAVIASLAYSQSEGSLYFSAGASIFKLQLIKEKL